MERLSNSNTGVMHFVWEKASGVIGSNLFAIAAFFVLVVLVWEGICRGFGVPTIILPPPSLIGYALLEVFIVKKMVFLHIYCTLVEIFYGFLIGSSLGLVLGILVGELAIVERVIYPYVVAFQALPKVALAPLIILWFGFGLISKVVLVAVMCFFPVLVNVVAGIQAANPELIDMMHSIPATRWQVFRMVKLPSSLPYIFAGLDVAATLSVIGAVVGEFVGSERGLGNLVLQMSYNFDTGGMFAMFVVLSSVGMAFHHLMVYMKRRLVFWA